MSKIGLSLSFCVADICRGTIQEADVVRIIANTNAPDEESMLAVVRQYQQSYWSEFPEQAAEVVERLLAAGKIDQPRTRGQQTHTVDSGHWMDEDHMYCWRSQAREDMRNLDLLTDPAPARYRLLDGTVTAVSFASRTSDHGTAWKDIEFLGFGKWTRDPQPAQ